MINMKTIYGISSIVMLLVIIFNLWNLYASWNLMILPAKLSYIFSSIIFNLIFFIMFLGLYKMTPREDKTLNEDQIKEIFKDYDKID